MVCVCVKLDHEARQLPAAATDTDKAWCGHVFHLHAYQSGLHAEICESRDSNDSDATNCGHIIHFITIRTNLSCMHRAANAVAVMIQTRSALMAKWSKVYH